MGELGQTSIVPFHVYLGDANRLVDGMLEDAPIEADTPCFCLIDQRTFECEWDTVRKIAECKPSGMKVEVFYFLANRWFDRARANSQDARRLEAWWGRPDFAEFAKQPSVKRALGMCERFRELGYEWVRPFAIYEHGGPTGRRPQTMYYMIHASDHAAATVLMARAYLAVQASMSEGPLPRELPFR